MAVNTYSNMCKEHFKIHLSFFFFNNLNSEYLQYMNVNTCLQTSKIFYKPNKISRLIFPYHLEKSKVYNEIYVCNVLYIPEFKMKQMKTFIGASKAMGRPLPPLSGFWNLTKFPFSLIFSKNSKIYSSQLI